MRLSGRERGEDAFQAIGYFAVGALLLLVLPEVTVSARPGAGEPPLWTGLVVIAVACLGETQRRGRPVLGLAVAWAAVLGGMLATGSSPLGAVLVFGDMLYCAILFTSRRASRAVAATAALVAGGLGLASLVSDGGRAALLTVLNLGLLLAIPVLWAQEVRRHREAADSERERTEQTRRMAELDRVAAITAERTRMARDLHDVIAGQLSAIAIQSEAALTLPDADPATLRRVLAAVRRDSVASLAEMRTMIGLLRADDSADAEPRTSPAGLGRLDDLLAAGRSNGLRIDVDDRRCGPGPVAAAVDLAAYRIVQESLTNAAKHAPGCAVRLTLQHRDGELVIEVDNDLVPDAPAAPGTGTGLVGLAERAGAVGGTVEAGRRGRIWSVRAALPVPVPDGVSR
ncbi:sensor histidine kinase [Pseudonocardia xinjiangensis]|uniref:sensor histidine kinase n=1 Tax=Pseudonocardia xinjiangensis TaxID=75289 RepID=UPI003D8CDE4D